MKPFSLLIKPVSADCNLCCSYCYYRDHINLYPSTRIHRMNDHLLEKLVRSYLNTEQPVYSFNWQGGEPTLMALDFFRRVVHLQMKYRGYNSRILNTLQTNGTLIDERYAVHFARHRYLIGVSLDGPEDIHDFYRKTSGGEGSFDTVLHGIQILKNYSVDINALVLVSKKNVSRAGDIYRFLKENGIYYHQYIPCVEFDKNGIPEPWTISGDEWGDFLCLLFDEWYKEDVSNVSVRIFDAVLNYIVYGIYTICTFGKDCSQYFVVEYNGDVYPCDFFVRKELNIGNIMQNSWDELSKSTVYKNFGKYKMRMNPECLKCRYLNLCNGDCLKHRMYAGNPPENKSWLCEGWKKFFDYTIPYFKKIMREYKNKLT